MWGISLFILVLLQLSCGSDYIEPVPTKTPTGDLERLYTKYESLAVKGQWANTTCDGLLFSSLQAVALNTEFPIEQAEIEPGRFVRKPPEKGDCFTETGSDISRDMMLGVILYSAHFRKVDILRRMLKYAKDNDMGMGRGYLETIMSPQLYNMVEKLIEKFEGRKAEWKLTLPYVYSAEPGYLSHLSMLSIHVYAIIHGGLTFKQLHYLKTIRDREPGNPLAQALYHRYTDGDQSEATKLIIARWPADRLPTTRDWCEEWVTQRADDDPAISQPCELPAEKHRNHAGGDLLFVTALILGKI